MDTLVRCKDTAVSQKGCSQRLWNQKTVYMALCCDRSEMTTQLFNFLSQNLSLVQSLFSGFGKIKRGSWDVLEKIVVQPFLRQLLLPSVRKGQLYLLAAAFKIPKSGKQPKVSFCSFFQNKAKKPNSQLFLYLHSESSFRFQHCWVFDIGTKKLWIALYFSNFT